MTAAVPLLALISLGLLPSAAHADHVRPVLSVEAGPAIDTDSRYGASLGARLGGELALGNRITLGAGIDGGVARWAQRGDAPERARTTLAALGLIHVGVRLGRSLRLEPAVGVGIEHITGDGVSDRVAIYSSTIAVVHRKLRAGIKSRIAIEDGRLDAGGSFELATELHLFVGAQY